MWAGHCVNCQKSVHRIKNEVHWPTEPVKCLMHGTLLKGPPNGYDALNTSRPTLIADFYDFFLANSV